MPGISLSSKRSFQSEEVQSICNMVPSPSGQPDILVWRGSANGVFTVKSAYHMENEKQLCSRGESSVAPQWSWVWQKLWRLHVPTVVKSFLWRVCHNSLPTRDNLHKRKITMDPLCPICGLFSEIIVHVVWSCSAATMVWMECSRRVQKLSLMETDGLLLAEKLMTLLDDIELELVLFLLRRLWLRHNTVVFGGILTPPLQLFTQSTEALEDFRLAFP